MSHINYISSLHIKTCQIKVQSKRNINKCKHDHSLCCIVMSSIQRLPHTVSEQLNQDNKKQALFKERSSIGFMSTPRSKTIYHDRKDWVMYQINLVTCVMFIFQHKTNLALNDWLDPQIILPCSSPTRYSKWCLYYVVACFLCWKQI